MSAETNKSAAIGKQERFPVDVIQIYIVCKDIIFIRVIHHMKQMSSCLDYVRICKGACSSCKRCRFTAIPFIAFDILGSD